MVIVRHVSALLLVLVAVFCGLMLLMYTDQGLIEHSLANARAIDLNFRRAQAEIVRFENRNGRLPTHDEMPHPGSSAAESVYAVHFFPEGFDECDGDPISFKTIPPGSYVLAVWRGEWWLVRPETPRSWLYGHLPKHKRSGQLNE